MSKREKRERRPLARGIPVICAIAATGAVAAPAQAGVVGPDRNLEISPAIDFLSVQGWPLNSRLRADVFRGATLIATKTGTVESGAKPGETVFEVNHVGGEDCWEGVPANTTPDIRGGDRIVVTVLAGGVDTADVNHTFARAISFTEGPDGTLTGTALGHEDGGAFDATAPVSLANAIMEAKRVAAETTDGEITTIGPNGEFTANPGGPPGEGEVFVDWVGTATGGGVETTTGWPVSEQGEQPCGPLLTTGLTQYPTFINGQTVNSPMVVGGPAADSTVTVTEVGFGGKTYIPQTADGAWTATIPAADLLALADGDHLLTVTYSSGTPDARTVVKDTVAPAIASSLAPGTYEGARTTTLSANGGEAVRYTLDGSAPSDASTLYNGVPIELGTGDHTLRARAVDQAGNVGAGSFAYTITAPQTTAQQGGSTSTAGTQPTGPGQSVGGSGEAPQLAPLALQRLVTSGRISHRSARRNGLRLVMRLSEGTEVLRIAVYRVSGGKRKLISLGYRSPSAGGLYKMRMRHKSLRRSLKPGRYVVEVTPGRSRTDLGKTARHGVTVKR